MASEVEAHAEMSPFLLQALLINHCSIGEATSDSGELEETYPLVLQGTRGKFDGICAVGKPRSISTRPLVSERK